MKTQKFYGDNMQQALALARHALGPDAVIVANRQLPDGIELEMSVKEDGVAVCEQQAASMPEAATLEVTAPVEGVRDLHDELIFLRETFKDHIAQLISDKNTNFSPLQALVLKKLQCLGISQTIAEPLVHDIADQITFVDAWRKVLSLLEQRILIAEQDLLVSGGVCAFVGPTGSGKTTTIAKLAAQYIKQHGTGKIAIITCDTNRAGAKEQVLLYGKVLGIGVHVATDQSSLSFAIEQLRNKQLVLIDTAGVGLRDKKAIRQQDQLFSCDVDIKTYITLPATFQASVMEEVITAFKHRKVVGGILTKVDESMSLAPTLNVAIEHMLSLLYISDGQDISKNLFRADANHLVKMASDMMQFKEFPMTD